MATPSDLERLLLPQELFELWYKSLLSYEPLHSYKSLHILYT